jgi:hypothetical protein
MWKQFLSGSAALALVVGMVGCNSDSSADRPAGRMMSSDEMSKMMTVAESDSHSMTTAPEDGTYVLVNGSRGLMTVTLKKGDPIGFKMMDGKNMAMAGDHSMNVTDIHASWQHGMQK